MKTSWKILVTKPYKTPILISLLLGCLMTTTAITGIISFQPVIPLFFSLASPSEQLVSKEWLLLFPTLSFLMTAVHGFWLQQLHFSDTLILQLMAWSTVMVQVLALLSLVRIVIHIT